MPTSGVDTHRIALRPAALMATYVPPIKQRTFPGPCRQRAVSLGTVESISRSTAGLGYCPRSAALPLLLFVHARREEADLQSDLWPLLD